MKNRIFSKMLFVGLMVFNSAVIYAAAAPEQASQDIYLMTKEREELLDKLIVDCNGTLQGAFVAAAVKGWVWAFAPLMAMGATIDGEGDVRGVALYCAADGGQEQAVRFLLENGATVNYRFANGYLPWHRAALHGYKEIIKLFIEFGIDIDARTDEFGFTALHIAAKEGHTPVVEYLVERGAKIDAVDLDNNTVLFSLLSADKYKYSDNLEKFYSGAKIVTQAYRAQLAEKYSPPAGKLTIKHVDIVKYCRGNKKLESLAYVFNALGREITSYLGKEDFSNLMNTGNTVFTKCALNEMPRRARLERLTAFINPAIQYLVDLDKTEHSLGMNSEKMKRYLEQVLVAQQRQEAYVPVQESAVVRFGQGVNASWDKDMTEADLARVLIMSQDDEELSQAMYASQITCYEEEIKQAAEASKERDTLRRAMKASEEMDMLETKRTADHEELLNAMRKKEEEERRASQALGLIRRGDDEEERALLEALINSRKENSATEAQADCADQDEDSFDCPSSSSEDEDC